MFSCRAERQGRTSIWLPKVFLFMFFQIMFIWLIGLYARFKSRGELSMHSLYTYSTQLLIFFFYFWSQSSKWRRIHQYNRNKKSTKVVLLKNGFGYRFRLRYWLSSLLLFFRSISLGSRFSEIVFVHEHLKSWYQFWTNSIQLIEFHCKKKKRNVIK